MRVVFDTNIYISALVFPGGLAEKAIYRVLEGKDELFISKAILDELFNRYIEPFLGSGAVLLHSSSRESDPGRHKRTKI